MEGPGAHSECAAFAFLSAVDPPSVRNQPPREALAGARQETRRALAHYVDQTAQGVLEGATSAVRHGTIGEAEEARGRPPRTSRDGRVLPYHYRCSALLTMACASCTIASRWACPVKLSA